MCGRVCLSLNVEDIRCACAFKSQDSQKYTRPEWLDEYNDGKIFEPSYNIAPTDVTPVLISAIKYKNAVQTNRLLKPMMWGIIPPWHKDDYRTHNLSTNNCRLENLRSSKFYNPILQNGGRCIIPVEGFYEWQTTIKTKAKQPYYIYTSQEQNKEVDVAHSWNNEYSELDGWKGGKLLYMAGIYNIWHHNETIIYSYSIITMESNNTFKWLHHRMPAILHSENQIDAWLDVENVDADMALAYLTPIQILSWHMVSTLVNNARNKSKECNKSVNLESKNKSIQKPLTAWFSKETKRNSTDDNCSVPKKFKH